VGRRRYCTQSKCLPIAAGAACCLLGAPASRRHARRGMLRSPEWMSAVRHHASAPHGSGGSVVDLRSDTVTKPSEAMLKAMSAAEVGDDVLGDDPTVKELEAQVAAMFGKEAAVFVPSGTMGNLVSVMAHTWERGSEYIVGDRSHIYIWEQGGGAQFGGAHPRAVPNLDDGTLPLDRVRAAIRGDDAHFPVSKLICIEDTHNMCGGRVLPIEYLDDIGALAREHGLAVHLDGARIWNALAASGVDGIRRTQNVDSLSVCLSKGLGAPVGSVVTGSAEFIRRCRRLRKGLGGGMRQSGVLAAAGLYALECNYPLIDVDHANAKRLAEGLSALRGLSVDMASVQSNVIMVDLLEGAPCQAPSLQNAVDAHGIRCIALSDSRIRLVTHIDIDAAGIEQAIAVFSEVLQ